MFKSLFLTAALLVASAFTAFAQCSNPYHFPVAATVPVQQAFDAAYVASLPVPVQALFHFELIGNPAVCTFVTTATADQQAQLFETLVQQGYGPSMVFAIAVDQWDPYVTFSMLSANGETWVANSVGVAAGSPKGYALPGATPLPGQLGPYPTTPPVGTIVVPPVAQLSAANANVTLLLASWFPPFATLNPVGSQSLTDAIIYLNTANVNQALFPNAVQYKDSRGTFSHVVVNAPTGAESYWEKQ